MMETFREESLGGGIRLLQNERFPLGTDSLLLSRFLTLPRAARVADLGAGNAALGLLLCVGSDGLFCFRRLDAQKIYAKAPELN